MTPEDIDVLDFRGDHRTGNWCCEDHHFASMLLAHAGDQSDGEIMLRGVQSITSMRWADLRLLEWLAGNVWMPVQRRHDLRTPEFQETSEL